MTRLRALLAAIMLPSLLAGCGIIKHEYVKAYADGSESIIHIEYDVTKKIVDMKSIYESDGGVSIRPIDLKDYKCTLIDEDNWSCERNFNGYEIAKYIMYRGELRFVVDGLKSNFPELVKTPWKEETVYRKRYRMFGIPIFDN